ncbi:MAG: 4Fe-4S dicluster domain-containing protein [Euryarchaeota archaeon]|nr:4Fe-4S dicluster domain-containing protein [Euryarchaeota archaeon]
MIKAKNLDPNFKYQLSKELGGENLEYCFNCTGCACGCPVAEVDPTFNPRKIIRMGILGMTKELIENESFWKCVSCYTCFARCPQDVRITEVLYALKNMAVREALKGNIKIKTTKPIFDKMFIDSIKDNGRVSEAMVFAMYKLKTKGVKELMKQFDMGLDMFMKGKIPILPEKIKGKKQVKHIFEKAGVK